VKRIAIALILAVIVFVTTIMVSIMYISHKSLETADYLNTLALDDFQTELNSDIMLTELSARNFLTGIPSVSVGSDSTSIIIDEFKLSEFKELIHEVLPQFMKINKYYQESMFIIDSDICRKYFKGKSEHYTKGLVPSVLQGDNTLHDLSGRFNFMESANYQKLKRDRKILWTTPQPTSPAEDRLLTLHVPISLSSGQFFGVFALSLDIKTINEKLKHYLPYGDEHSAIFIVDENNNIFSSYPEWIMEPDYQEAIRKSTDLLKRHDRKIEHDIYEFEGKELYVYQRDQLLLPWRIFTANHPEAIYHEAMHVIKALILSSITGMLFMLICCIVIFRQIRKNLRQKAAIEEELRMAAAVQTSMLKPSTYILTCHTSPITLHAFIQPAKETGGDLYDYIEKDGKLIFCIGDVSGKGMSAALFMTQVVSLFRNAVRYTTEPSEIVSQINNVLSDNPEMTFCTFFVGLFCSDEISFCNAGHNPPVLITSGASYLKVRPNLAIGLMEGYPYRSETIPFLPGDKLVLYTDGVTEAKGRGCQRYGGERLLHVLDSLPRNADAGSGLQINTSITKAIEQFVERTEQSDDITIVSIVNPTESPRCDTIHSPYVKNRFPLFHRERPADTSRTQDFLRNPLLPLTPGSYSAVKEFSARLRTIEQMFSSASKTSVLKLKL